jgi:hypothetical protein
MTKIVAAYKVAMTVMQAQRRNVVVPKDSFKKRTGGHQESNLEVTITGGGDPHQHPP